MRDVCLRDVCGRALSRIPIMAKMAIVWAKMTRIAAGVA